MTNYPRDIATFPFPFDHDSYRFTVNLSAGRTPVETAGGAWGDTLLWVEDGPYQARLEQRRDILSRDNHRYDVPPNMQPAAWDALLFLMQDLARCRPEAFSLLVEGDGKFLWTNTLLGAEQRFTFGDPSSLPCEPLAYIGEQVGEDLLLLDQRDNQLWLEGGLLTFPIAWSLPFSMGMSFQEIHATVPHGAANGMFGRAEQFLMKMHPGDVFRRTNWNFLPGFFEDYSPEVYEDWLPSRLHFEEMAKGQAGAFIHLRVEIQQLVRLPRTGAILFLICPRTISLERLAMVPEWSKRILAVVEELPDDIASYKGLELVRAELTTYLRGRLATTV